jgi:hypothetical protein
VSSSARKKTRESAIVTTSSQFDLDLAMKKKELLSGHKRVGKKFIPPLMQLPGMRSMSYVDDILPELIWLGLINDTLGFVAGARFFEQIVKAAIEATEGKHGNHYALLSLYRSFDSDQKERFVKALTQASILNPLREYVAPLVLLYDECPIRFLGPPETVKSKEQLLRNVKTCIELHVDKYETPGIVLNGMILISRFLTKSIHFSSNIELPDLNAVINRPGSEDAKRAAGFIRSNVLADFGMMNIDKTWAQHFWSRGYELSPCEFNYDE